MVYKGSDAAIEKKMNEIQNTNLESILKRSKTLFNIFYFFLFLKIINNRQKEVKYIFLKKTKIHKILLNGL